MNRLFWLLMMAVLATVTMDSRAEVRLPAVIGDNMVLQQGKRLPIWGWAAPGETVTVTIAGQTKKAVANAQGQWRVKLEPLKTGEPLEMKIQGKNALTLKNILVGEVWVCSGQSNMQYPLIGVNDHEREIAQANYPQMRLFSVPAGGRGGSGQRCEIGLGGLQPADRAAIHRHRLLLRPRPAPRPQGAGRADQFLLRRLGGRGLAVARGYCGRSPQQAPARLLGQDAGRGRYARRQGRFQENI